MLIFVKMLTYLTVQQGINQDTKVNKKLVFLWLVDRMCSKAIDMPRASSTSEAIPTLATARVCSSGRLDWISVRFYVKDWKCKNKVKIKTPTNPSLQLFAFTQTHTGDNLPWPHFPVHEPACGGLPVLYPDKLSFGCFRDISDHKRRVFSRQNEGLFNFALFYKSNFFENEYNFILEHYEGKTWNERHRETQFASGIWMFYQKVQKSVFLVDFSDQNCLLSLIQL